MPGGDGTGPWGQGPGTGWGLGGCVPVGRGRGRGGWWGRFFGRDEAAELKAERDSINARLAEIEKEKK